MSSATSGPPAEPLGPTYRLQLHRDFGLASALALVDYLHDLGIGALYLSPLTAAVPGSLHGYDVVDPTRLNPELGTPADLEELSRRLRQHGMGLLLDIVPNHMGIAFGHNRWWNDVLEHGPASPFARFFDIDWQSPRPDLASRVLLPVLGGEPASVVAGGELEVVSEEGKPWLRYHEHRFPLAPGSVEQVLAEEEAGRGREVGWSPERLRRLLELQHYRLDHWRRAATDLNYRRFFNVNELVALRQEDPVVFASTHAFVLDLLQRGIATALRVDHVDGLHDPERYLVDLAQAAAAARRLAGGEGCYLAVEKILDRDERLRASWPVYGSTGYDFANLVNGLFVDPEGEAALRALYRDFTGDRRPFPEVLLESKLEVLRSSFACDLARLGRDLALLAAERPQTLPPAAPALEEALAQVAAAFPLYRSYVRPAGPIDATDAALLAGAVEAARHNAPALDPELLELVAWALCGDGETAGALESRRRDFVARFQQLSAPAMAKGLEDTALYRYFPLASLNDVGGDPDAFATTPDELHHRNQERLRAWPDALLATSTHDSKRSEDVRLRIDVLSEMPEEWRRAVERFRQLNRPHRRGPAPHPAEEYLFYQTLAGFWPDRVAEGKEHDELVARVEEYLVKAMREAKERTRWRAADEEHEGAVCAFVRATLAPGPFLTELGSLVAGVARAGRLNSLAQTLLKVASPGIPDFYQGCELETLALVDPDNRRPVDFDRRRRLLAGLAAGGEPPAQDALKLWVTSRSLAARRRRPATFTTGRYTPLAAQGPAARRLVAFARGSGDGLVIAVAGRFFVSGRDQPFAGSRLLLPAALGAGRLRDALGGSEVEARPEGAGLALPLELLDRLPVALLERA